MITIISASNREGNNSQHFARHCEQYLLSRQQAVKVFYLDELPDRFSLRLMFQYETSFFSEISKAYIRPSEKLLFILPEYNGSFPGLLKLLIDAIQPEDFKGKKAAMIGISAGRAGNLRGMDHLTDILHYLQVEVMPFKLPISKVSGLMGEHGSINDTETIRVLEQQLNRLIAY